MMKFQVLAAAGMSLVAATPAVAQDAGDIYVRVAASRTKLLDHGDVAVAGTVNPAADLRTRDNFHGTVTGGYYVVPRVAVEASVATPLTVNHIPAGALAGTPNLGDTEFTIITLGASLHPFKGMISPYVGGGLQLQFTTQERDGLAVGLHMNDANGPYAQAGVDVALSPRFGVFAEARKAFYDTRLTGELPTDATYTSFVPVGAHERLDPFTVQLGVTAKFGSADGESATPIGTDTTKWTVRGGLTTLTLADKLRLNVGGAPYPGTALSTFEHQTVSLQVGRFLTRNIALNATVGIPPTIDIFGAGSIGALPKLGRATYGPVVGTVQYYFTRSGRVRPYVGAGGAYMIVFHTDDGAFGHLRVHNDVGPAFEAGSDFMVSNQWSIFADAKKAFLRPTTTGTYAGLDVVGHTRLDPWAFTGGVGYHF